MFNSKQQREYKTIFRDFLVRLRTISKLANDESDAVYALYLSENGGSVPDPHIISEPLPCEHALNAFLLNLPSSVLYSLLALMYTGRDGYKNPIEYFQEIWPGFRDEKLVIRTIVEKLPRMKYIDKALLDMNDSELRLLLSSISKIIEADK